MTVLFIDIMLRCLLISLLLMVISTTTTSSSTSSTSSTTYDIIFNALDKYSVENAISFLEHTKTGYYEHMELFKDSNKPNIMIYLFITNDGNSMMTDGVKKKLESLHINPIIYQSSPIQYSQLGRPDAPVELVSYILESLMTVHDDIKSNNNNDEHKLVSISFQKSSVPKASKKFFNIFKEMTNGNDVLLLDKTKKFNSVSDWHDLIITGMIISKPSVQLWLQTVCDIFKNHATNRDAYVLVDPRPALLEASLRHQKIVKVKYLTHEEICAIACKSEKGLDKNNYISDYYHEQHKEKLHDRRCSMEYDQYVEIDCEDESSSVNHVCMVIDEPIVWKSLLDRNVEQHLEGKWGRGLTKDKWRKDLPDGMGDGSIRFRNSPSSDTPRSFCWQTGTSTELAPESKIYHTGWDNYTKYEKVEKTYEKKLSIVMLSGKQASANAIDKKLYISLSKMMYCKRHGYKFVELFSNEYSHYFHHNLFSSLESGMAKSEYFRGIMSKILMMLQTMHSNPSSEWVVWTDDDVFINTGWLYMPLDEFLQDVPQNKVMVMNNYRSAFTNIIFLRNTEQGRALVYDWLAVAMSGLVQCHGFDQAALGTLILLRVFGRMVAEPFGHTCTWSQEGSTGCNEKNDWSCDFKFEKSLYRAGFRTKRADFFGMKISSFTKGCANDFIPDFHVLYETKTVPRIQCGLCSRLTEVNSMGHYDGPRGGGNDVVRLGAIDGWFFGHKAEWLFYEAYLESKNCKRVDDFIENCDIPPLHSEKAENWVRAGRNFISLTDGYAFDLVNQTYCKIIDPALLLEQRQKTYMKEYPEAIAIANDFSAEEWETRYKATGTGDGRLPCTEVPGKCKNEGPDGMDNIVHNEQTQERMFDKPNCESCRKIEKIDFGYDKRTAITIDCRSEDEERMDKDQDVNQDGLL